MRSYVAFYNPLNVQVDLLWHGLILFRSREKIIAVPISTKVFKNFA